MKAIAIFARTALVIAAVLFAGCIYNNTIPSAHIMSGFNEGDFERFAGKGTAIIQGQAFGKTRGGDVKLAAGNEVRLFPVNTYTEEAVRSAQTGIQPTHDPKFFRYVRKATADATGSFDFREIPAGKYYLECAIFWETGAGRTGGVATQIVTVTEGQTVKVLLTI